MTYLTHHNSSHDQRGFTLVEMLVAVSLFTVVVIAIFDMFMIAQRAQRQAASLENLQDDMRFSLNRIADELRDGSIDYTYYGANGVSSGGNNELAIRTFDGAAMHIKMGTGSGDCIQPTVSPETKRCLLINENIDDPSSQWHSMTSDGVSVDSLKFYITPSTNPFEINTSTNTYNADIQPRVRIVMSGSGKIRQTDRRVSIALQTLVSTREYRR